MRWGQKLSTRFGSTETTDDNDKGNFSRVRGMRVGRDSADDGTKEEAVEMAFICLLAWFCYEREEKNGAVDAREC